MNFVAKGGHKFHIRRQSIPEPLYDRLSEMSERARQRQAPNFIFSIKVVIF